MSIPNLLISEGIVIHRRRDPFGKIVSPLFLDFPLNLNNLIGCEYMRVFYRYVKYWARQEAAPTDVRYPNTFNGHET